MAEPYRIHHVGAARTPLRDAYHAFLQMGWPLALGLIVATYLAVNLVFALIYLAVGGVAHANPRSLSDAYIFSVQTMATIGYGDMHPIGAGANAVVIIESVTGLLITAVATGLVFSKFARARARVAFARRAVLSPVNGVPHLMVRLGNQRGNNIVEATLRLDLTRTERTSEGHTIYRLIELGLTRARAPQFSRSWTIMHVVDEKSPLFGRTPAQVESEETEFIVTIVGLDDTTAQNVHAAHRYLASEVAWGARYVDILSELPNGDMLLDLRRFHDVEPTAPVDGFPYPS